MAENFANNYQTTLNGSITSTATTLVVTSATGAPAANFRILIDNEYMLVTNVSGTTFTVTRHIEGSTAAIHADQATVTQVVTLAGLLQYIQDNAPTTFANITVNGGALNSFKCTTNADTDGSTITFDASISNWHKVTLGGNRALALANDVDDQQINIILKQDATGGRNPSWWAGILWASGTVPDLTTAVANKYNVFSIKRLASGIYLGWIVGLNH
jgi:hypothetical protein